MAPPVHITFLGGLGEIGRNCACIESDGKIVLIDCGIMFPDIDMPGIDLVLPDFTYLRANADRVVGCIATHGHEDHVGGLSFLLRELKFPIYGSELTLGLARHRIEEAGLVDRTDFRIVADNERLKIGPFDCEFLPVTHSVPHGFATAIHTPQGTILHTGDFKLDLNPVDGRLTDLSVMGAIAQNEGIRLLLSDSTNADSPGHSRSETSVGAVLYNVMHAHEGRRLIVTCFASPHPPGPAGRRCRPVLRPSGGHPRPVHEEERGPGPQAGRVAHPRLGAHRHRGHRRPAARRGVRDLHRLAG